MTGWARDLVYRGTRHVDGLLLTDAASERIVAQWSPGSAAFRLDDGQVLLRFAKPRLMRCETAPGLPLVAAGGVLAGAVPVGERPVGDVLQYRGGELVGSRIVEPVSMLGVLDLSEWRVVRPRPAAVAQRSAPKIAPPALALPEPPDPRTALGVAPPTNADRRSWDRVTVQADESGGRSPWNFIFERRQQRYLNELERLFSAGRTEEALRRAIPFGGHEGGRRASRGPKRRDDLRITATRTPATRTMQLGTGMEAMLRQRYRKAFHDLDSQGRVDDAAFVLVELLNSAGEAVSYLERHDRLTLAAEIAEARDLDPSLAVRLWWRAGDAQRAVALARRHGCFAQAVRLLAQGGHTKAAEALRREWAGLLLAGGDLIGALDAAAELPVTPAHRAWRSRVIDLAVESEGLVRARALARQLRFDGEEAHPAITAVLDPGASRADRRALAVELTAAPTKITHPCVARDLLRATLSERAELTRQQIDRLVTLSRDGVLRADIPPRVRGPAPEAPDTLFLDRDGADRGLVRAYDARVLPNGRIALALGGAGIQILNRSGSIVQRFDVPAWSLITHDLGTRLLAIRPLDPGAISVTAVDLVGGSGRQLLGEFSTSRWADTYDGLHWFVASGPELWMLDVLSGSPATLWRDRPTEASGPLVSLVRGDASLAIVRAPAIADGLDPFECQVFALPQLSVRGSFALSGVDQCVDAKGVPQTGDLCDENARVVVEGTEAPGLRVIAAVRNSPAAFAVLTLAQSSEATVHLDHGHLVVTDDLGRIDVVDLAARRSALSATVQV